jgi:hypothetical protein
MTAHVTATAITYTHKGLLFGIDFMYLRNNFPRLSKWLEKGETGQFFKGDKRLARVVSASKAGTFLGCMAGTAKAPADIDEPLGIEWEATR